MAQQLVIRDGMVIATHETYQDLTGLYPDCEIVTWTGTRVVPYSEDGIQTPDPRTT